MWNQQISRFLIAVKKELFQRKLVYLIIANDVPGGNRILIIKIKAQRSALSKAIKNTEFK